MIDFTTIGAAVGTGLASAFAAWKLTTKRNGVLPPVTVAPPVLVLPPDELHNIVVRLDAIMEKLDKLVSGIAVLLDRPRYG